MADNNTHKIKAAALRAIMSHPKLSAQILAGYGSAVGSTKRTGASRTLKVIDAATQKHLAKYQPQQPADGQGGPSSVLPTPTTPATPPPTSPLPSAPTDLSNPAPTSTTASPTMPAQNVSLAYSFDLKPKAATPPPNTFSTPAPKTNKSLVRGPQGYTITDYTAPKGFVSDKSNQLANSFFKILQQGLQDPNATWASKAADVMFAGAIGTGFKVMALADDGTATVRDAIGKVSTIPGALIMSAFNKNQNLNPFSSPFGGSQPGQLGGTATAGTTGSTGPVLGPPAPSETPVTVNSQIAKKTGISGGPTQVFIDTIYKQMLKTAMAGGQTPEQADITAKKYLQQIYGMVPSIGPDGNPIPSNSGSSMGMGQAENLLGNPLSTKSAQQKWWDSLSPEQKVRNQPLWDAYQAKLGPEGFALSIMSDTAKMAALTGLPKEIIDQWPIDAFAGANYNKIRDAMALKGRLGEIESVALNEGIINQNTPEFGRQYIRDNDQFAKKLDGMIKDFDTDSVSHGVEDPFTVQRRQQYRNYLTGLKADQMQRYDTVLTDSIAVEQSNYTAHMTFLNSLITKIQEDTNNQYATEQNRYTNIKSLFTSAYNALDQAGVAESNELDMQIKKVQAMDNLLTSEANRKLLPLQIANQTQELQNQQALLKLQSQQLASGNITGTEDSKYTRKFADDLAWSSPPKTDSNGNVVYSDFNFLSPEAVIERAKGAQFGTQVQKTYLSDYARNAGVYFGNIFETNRNLTAEWGKLLGTLTVPNGDATKEANNTLMIEGALSNIGSGGGAFLDNKDPGGANLTKLASILNKKGTLSASEYKTYSSIFGSWFVDALLQMDKLERTTVQPPNSTGAFFGNGVDASKDPAQAKDAALGAIKALLYQQAMPYLPHKTYQ